MATSVTALYNDLSTARRVVEELVNTGIERGDISLMANDATGKYASHISDRRVDDNDVHGDEGASFGAVVGAMVGLGAMLIPGIGPVIAAGPLVAGLIGAGVGAAAGAVTGGITASLVKFGVDEETAGYYAEGVRRGGTLVVAHVADSLQERTSQIMNRHNPVDVKTSADRWRSGGWTGFDERGTTYTSADYAATGVRPFDEYAPTFRSHYASNYANSGYDYDYYAPAYKYGYTLAHDPRYRYDGWAQVEAQARRDWEQRYDSAWDRVKDAVRSAWENVKEAVR